MGVDDFIARIDAVTPDDVRSVARDVLAGDWGLSVIGPFDDKDFSAAVA
jgi:predicted Zn-dependent peptidase